MKTIKIAAVSAAAMMLAASVQVHCEEDVKVMLDGVKLNFDVPPQIIDDRTFVPLRVIFEAMGAEVDWDGDARKVTASNGETTVEMVIDNTVMTVNGKEIILDVPPQIVEDRTLVPARAVAESFGAEVTWMGDTRTVIITSAVKEEATPAPTAAPAEEFPVKYNRAKESEVNYAYGFKLKNVTKNEDGKYEIEYYFETFKEGSGSITVMFNCLDASGNVVDTFGGNYFGIDYTWSPQNATAVISDKTVTIELKI